MARSTCPNIPTEIPLESRAPGDRMNTSSEPGASMKTQVALALAVASAVGFNSRRASAEFLTVYGGPTYDTTAQIGFVSKEIPQQFGVNLGGTAIGTTYKYNSGSTTLGERAVR